jgi:hypothetical protein
MKKLIRLDEQDIRKLVANLYDVPLDNVMTTIIEEPHGYHEEMTLIFYVEVELKGEK